MLLRRAIRRLAWMETAAPPPDSSSLSRPAPRRRALPFLVLATIVFLADQSTKLAVITFIPENGAVPASGWVQLTHITNTGAAFGLLQGQTLFLMVASFIGIFGIVAYYRANGRKSLWLRLALGLVLGGALGNLVDRVFRGAVVDFIYVQILPGFHWPAFNIADSSLLIGLAALGLYVIRQRRPDVPLPPPHRPDRFAPGAPGGSGGEPSGEAAPSVRAP